MSDTTPKDETAPETPPEPKGTWEKREFAINRKMKDVCRLGIKATEAEITNLKRKLKKLQYGS